MRFLSLDDLKNHQLAFDAQVQKTAHIDHFCSSSMWILPAAHGLMPPREPWIWQTPNGYIALMKGHHPRVGTFLQPLEGAWAFPSALIGPNPLTLVRSFADLIGFHRDWDSIFLSGLDDQSPLFQALVYRLQARYKLYFAKEPTQRHHADLRDGAEALLARRSRNFRRSLKRSVAQGQAEGITFIDYDENATAPTLFERILAIEKRSWKAKDGSGICVGTMRDFYQKMLPMLMERGALCLYFAQQGGVDIGYILGARWNGVYRGLQFSFDDAHRHLGLGNLMQWHQLQALEGQGIHTYDLGSDSPYKARWSDHIWQTQTLIIYR